MMAGLSEQRVALGSASVFKIIQKREIAGLDHLS